MKDKLGMLVLVRGITGFTVRVVGVVIVGLLSRLAVLATWAKEGEFKYKSKDKLVDILIF